MPGTKERICIACRGKYHYCPKCTEDANKPVWMFAFCSEECKETFTVVRDYCSNKITKSGAKSILSKVIKSPFDKFDSSITTRLNEIFREDLEEHMNAPEEPTEDEETTGKKTVRRGRKRTTTETNEK